MSRLASIALVVGFGAASALAQNHVAISGARQSSEPMTQGRFVVPQGRRPLIGLTGPSVQDGMQRRSGGRNRFFYGGYFPPEYNAYGPEQYYAYGPEPLTPAPQAAAVAPPKQEPVPNGVMLELQGNHWVKVDSFTTVAAASPEASSPATSGPGVASPAGKELAAKEIPASVLVYRNGRTEEVRSYSIIGTTMYTKADYWSTGAWTRKIPIADLDLPATVQKNHERGLGFQLPSGPDEVILRP